jgi:hypothetical protein
MPLNHDAPDEGFTRELREVAREADALREALTKSIDLNLPADFPKEVLVQICHALAQLSDGTIEGNRSTLEYARNQLPAIRREHVKSEELNLSNSDVPPPVLRGALIDQRLTALIASVTTALDEYRPLAPDRSGDESKPEMPINPAREASNILFLDPVDGRQARLAHSEFSSLIQGSSIKSVTFTNDFIELGLSDAFNLQISGQIGISLISTLKNGEQRPMRLQILGEDEAPFAAAIEEGIRSFRQLYATAFLFDAGRSEQILSALEANPDSDLEQYLEAGDRLLISAAGEGSFWLTVLTKSDAAFKALLSIALVVPKAGRWVEAEAKLKELDVAEKKIKLNKMHVELLRKAESITDPRTRKKVKATLLRL